MVIHKTICIPFELDEKLKKEESASALVCNLLEAHYKISEKTEEQVLEEVHKKIGYNSKAEDRERQKLKDIEETAEINQMLAEAEEKNKPKLTEDGFQIV